MWHWWHRGQNGTALEWLAEDSFLQSCRYRVVSGLEGTRAKIRHTPPESKDLMPYKAHGQVLCRGNPWKWPGGTSEMESQYVHAVYILHT